MNSKNFPGLIGHWPLKRDGRNFIEGGSEARPIGELRYNHDGALFDGRTSKLEIGDQRRLFGSSPFTLAARICIDADEPESIGDIASKFDPALRTGFNLSVVDHGGVTSASANYRNLSFSFDAATGPRWTECGRPGNAVHICALTVHNGELYAGTFEYGEREIGHVFRFVGGRQWEDTGLPCKANSVFAMVSINGVLYAASGRYDPRNSALENTGNMNEESRVWRLEADGVWRDCGSPLAEDDLYNLGIYRGRLYATPSFTRGLLRYEGDQRWTRCAEPYPRLLTICQWRGHLYGGSNKALRKVGPAPERELIFTMLPDAEGAYRYDDVTNAWAGCGPIPTETQLYSFVVHRGALHTGGWPSAKVFRSATGVGWQDCGQLHPDEKEVMAMCVYNGMLYVGTLPSADVYRYDDDNRWTKVGNVDSTPNMKYRRAWSMAAHDGGLFVGALPTGNVYKMTTGVVASDSHQLTTGWHRIVAVRDGAIARLYVDGKLRAEHRSEKTLDLTNDAPLNVGFGAHDFFRGKIADLRLYERALDAREIRDTITDL